MGPFFITLESIRIDSLTTSGISSEPISTAVFSCFASSTFIYPNISLLLKSDVGSLSIESSKWWETCFSVSSIKKIFNLGYPSALQMMFEVGFFISGIWVCGIIGINYQAANQIALNLSSLTFMVALGLSVAATIRVGNQKGLNNYKNLKRIAISIFLITIMIEFIFALIFIILSDLLPWLYLDNNGSSDVLETVTLASKLLIVVALFQIFDGIQIVAQGALRGIQDVKIPSIICFLSYVVFGIPIMIYLGLYTELKATGVWIGFLIGLMIASILLSRRFFKKCNIQIKR